MQCSVQWVFYNCIDRAHDSVKHYTVSCLNDGKYRLGQAVFHDVNDFIQHFLSQPLLAGESGSAISPALCYQLLSLEKIPRRHNIIMHSRVLNVIRITETKVFSEFAA